MVGAVRRWVNAGAHTRQPSPFPAFQLWCLLHGLTDPRAGKPEMPWPEASEMIDHYLVSVGLRRPPSGTGAQHDHLYPTLAPDQECGARLLPRLT
jgi:hypothetical protein